MRATSTIITMLALLALPATASAACGDNDLEAGEACDDGNIRASDGCSATCTIESGFACREQDVLDIRNGSFEMGLGASNWTTVGTVDLLMSSPCYPAGDRNNVIDINGTTRGEIFQDLATTPGRRYLVTFLGSANCREIGADPCNLTCSKTLTISAGVGDVPFATSTLTLGGSPQAVGYERRTFEFVATTASTRLRFSGTDVSLAGAMIDGVVTPASVCGASSCGNGALDGPETCDDGNAMGGDGCSSSCGTEPGYQCMSPGEPCKATCGDGLKVELEECDDGDMPAANGDGCSDECEIEDGWSCVIDPLNAISICAMTCGDGDLDAGETCDDGNANDLDACSNSCRRGPGADCLLDSECNLRLCPGDVNRCGGCYDLGLGAVDFGCSGATPACFTGGDAPTCVGCATDEDCDEGVSCSPATRTCGGVPPADGGVPVDGGPIAMVDAGPPVDGGPRPPGVSGGALCSVSSPGSSAPVGASILLALAALGLAVRRRRS